MKVGQNADKKNVLNQLLDLGMVLVAIDARAQDVDVPDHLGIDPQLRLNLSWRFGRPMEIDTWGIFAELTFGGVPYPCKFPWDAIFLIVSHVNGESYLFPDHVPRELLHQAAAEHVEALADDERPKSKRGRPKLSLVPVGDDDEGDESDAGEDGAQQPSGSAAKRGTETATGKDPDEAHAPLPLKPSRSKRGAAAPAADAKAAHAKTSVMAAVSADEGDDPGSQAAADPTDTARPERDHATSSNDGDPPPGTTPKRSRGHLRLIK